LAIQHAKEIEEHDNECHGLLGAAVALEAS
jgi:hypothetical protein